MALDMFGAIAAGRKRWEGTTQSTRSAAMRKVVQARWAKRPTKPAAPAKLSARQHAAALLASLPPGRQFAWWRERLPELLAILPPE